MILLTLHLLSFPFEDDTKVNPYAGGDGEYRDACPSSLHRCLLDSPPKRVQPSPGLFAFWRRKWQPTPILLPRKFHGWRRLVGYSPWGCKESDTPERLHFLCFYSLTGGEGNDHSLGFSNLLLGGQVQEVVGASGHTLPRLKKQIYI